jgi:hypothetical protein
VQIFRLSPHTTVCVTLAPGESGCPHDMSAMRNGNSATDPLLFHRTQEEDVYEFITSLIVYKGFDSVISFKLCRK